ncbi:aldo/keto reductase [Tengunoibacter tsumagoiensis]|uniref:Oxidoreductase n=1 Tax=Tengunoibacter tsumagoiensis TaxID=2014871 RepID=A0A401ZV33_9CHLR|nr:aldo/keto reductase [Tengunoibacter tsumagoiensis]GCE10697.1 oxidoreductase [Tengunoibacter tsumagoiensis]
MTSYPSNQHQPLAAASAGTVTVGNDIIVNRIGFGTMRLPGPGVWGEPANPTEAKKVLQRAVELGVNFIDTAAYYGPDVANRLIVEALYPYPENLIIATKVGAKRGEDKSWNADMRPENIKAACEENLRQLRLEQLHLVHCRYMTKDVPFAESVGALADLQREGKIRHVGVSNVTLEQLVEAQSITQIASVQNLYNLEHRSHEDVLQACTEQGIIFTPFFPLAMGKLGQTGGPLTAIAQHHHATPAQIALAWLLALSPMMLAIPGTSSQHHLEENIAGAAIHLTPSECATIESALA